MDFKQAWSTLWRGLRGIIAATISGLWRFLKQLLCSSWQRLKTIGHALWQIWLSLGTPWMRRIALVLIVLVVACQQLQQFLQPNLTREEITAVHYLNDGWDSQDRENYYYSPQGTELLGIDYDWYVNLELPMSTSMFNDPDTMRGWGFIVDPGQQASRANPGNLAVGLTRHTNPDNQKVRLDITCAACHTGELHYKGTALRVDGGQAVQSIATPKPGEFITTLALATIETYINPAKWDRFADRVAGPGDDKAREQLRKDVREFIGNIIAFVRGPGALSLYPVEEGRGRTDAVARIGNVVFGYDIKQPQNYQIANAPVSYPFMWDIWRFDWVQYSGFTNQPMARNLGEALGVLAPIKLVDEDGKLLTDDSFGDTAIDLTGMHCIETTLRKLKPPAWPEEILGRVDIDKARHGKALFADQCAFCHGPHVSKPYDWPLATKAGELLPGQASSNPEWDLAGDLVYKDGKPYRRDWRETIWSVPWIDVDVVGTDPNTVDNFNRPRYDATLLAPGSGPVNAGQGLQVLLNILVPRIYEKEGITGELIPDYDGTNVPFRISDRRAYKSRPLHGVWATPPFLHNGSVPTIYDLLSPLEERPTQFAVGNRDYDPVKLGYVTEAGPGSFVHDTSVDGNSNRGHLFTDVAMPGRIGDRLPAADRLALIEYLKVMGNPKFSDALGGDPMNWDNYSPPPEDKTGPVACEKTIHRFDLQARAEVQP